MKTSEAMEREYYKAAIMEARDVGVEVTSHLSETPEELEKPLSISTSGSETELSVSGLDLSNTPSWVSRLRSRICTRDSRPPQRGPQQVVRKLQSCPRGYLNLAAFVDSDEHFALYRRFGFLQARLLLEKQAELRELEESLDRLDKREAKAYFKHPMTRDFPEAEVGRRRELLPKIEEKFWSYANLIDAAHKMMALNRPSKGDYESVRNYMYNHKPLLEAEASWIYKKEDIITLRASREHAWLVGGIEILLNWFHCSLLERIFGDEQTRQKSNGIEVYYSRERIDRLVSCIIAFMVLLILVVPVYVLWHLINHVDSGRATAIQIVISTLVFQLCWLLS